MQCWCDVECPSLDAITFYKETLHSIRKIQVDDCSFDSAV